MKKFTFLFDIDGTLLDSQRAGAKAIDQVFPMVFGIQRDPSKKLVLHGRTDRGIMNELLAAHDIEANDDNFDRFANHYVPVLETTLKGLPATVCPGVYSLLEYLSGRKEFALGLLTGNLEAGAWVKLKSCGLDRFFDFGGFGDQHPLRDDVARKARLAAQEHLGAEFSADQIIVVGDTVNDITCGLAIGAKPVGVLTGGGQIEELLAVGAHVVLNDFECLTHGPKGIVAEMMA